MLDQEIRALILLALAKNYNEWIFSFFKPHISGKILEVGCGFGNFTKYLAKYRDVTCIDKEDVYVTILKSIYRNIRINTADITKLNSQNQFDTVVCINVLDHVENDILAINRMIKSLTDTGKLLLIVPTVKWLYSSKNPVDVSVGHYRRFNKKEILYKIKLAGGRIESLKYINFIGILSWYIQFCLLKRKSFSVLLLLQDMFVPIISWIEKIIPIPIGLSLFIVIRKEHK